MKIIRKLKAISDFISTPQGAMTGVKIQEQAMNAILHGIGSDEWIDYMKNFHSNPKQLERLTGKDQTFLDSEYGKLILTYVVGNAMCGGGTTITTGRNFLPETIRTSLDNDLGEEMDDSDTTVRFQDVLTPLVD